MAIHIQFDQANARQGGTVTLTVKINNYTGNSSAIPAVLKIFSESDDFNVDITQSIFIQPTPINVFTKELKVPVNLTKNSIAATVEVLADDRVLARSTLSVDIPDAVITFSKPQGVYNGGNTIPLTMENTGGTKGRFQLLIRLRDTKGKEIYRYEEKKNFDVKETHTIVAEIPPSSANGFYILSQQSTNLNTKKQHTDYTSWEINGLSTDLKSNPVKNIFFSNELVGAKSEVGIGRIGILGATLHARITRIKENINIEAALKEKTSDSITSFCVDSKKRIWVGTINGIAMWDDRHWKEYNRMPDGSSMARVDFITVGPGDIIYALTSGKLIALDGDEWFPIPYGYAEPGSLLAVDDQDRIWSGIPGEGGLYVSYFDNDKWNNYGVLDSQDAMLSDRKGGIWFINAYGLTHINKDLIKEEFPGQSYFSGDKIFGAFVDKSSKLWFVTQSDRRLYSFDGSAFNDYAHFEDIPKGGVISVTVDDGGAVYCIGVNENGSNSVYKLDKEHERFVKTSGDYFVDTYEKSPQAIAMDSAIYTPGYFFGKNNWEHGLLKIGNISGTLEEQVWKGMFPVHGPADSLQRVVINTGRTFAPGFYLLKTSLVSSLGQELANTTGAFSVRPTQVSVSLFTDGLKNGYVKTGDEVQVKVEALNNTKELKNGLEMTAKIVAPSGVEEQVLAELVNLEPRQSVTRTINFKETMPGIWRIFSQLGKMESQLALRVVEPTLKMDVLAPPYAEDDPFDMNVRLVNESTVPINFSIRATVEGRIQPAVESAVTLGEKEERVFSFRDVLSLKKSRNYTFTIRGDVVRNETVTVKYGKE
ncbi:MAG: two-component regulator propeller domain-containing protein [Candidatus Omnitrophota bacterium]